MTIAIDYDYTWTKDPRFWSLFAFQCELSDHRLVMITCRHSGDFVANDVPVGINVFYTNGIAKQAYADSIELPIDIWIDDDPGTISPSKKLSNVPDISL